MESGGRREKNSEVVNSKWRRKEGRDGKDNCVWFFIAKDKTESFSIPSTISRL